jgi:aryl-alcohol dehydrogenase-like predicted oxidoreductase
MNFTSTPSWSPSTSARPTPGFATPEATQSGHFSNVEKRTLGRTGLTVSTLGFGTYRTGRELPYHRQALEEALKQGCNLIDTSTNYMDGEAERLVGEVLKASPLPREQTVVVTKVGYAQGANLKIARDRELEGRPYAEMNRINEECWHCISPEWIHDQISASLQRLQVETIDIVLLHNPEYFFKAQGGSQDHREYYRRIEKAFEALEDEVSQGRIRWYGVSSNTFPEPRETEDYTSLEALVDLVEEMSAKRNAPSHFAVIQLPFNPLEPGALFEDNQSGKSVLEYAKEKNLGVLVNRPLNAFTERQLIRLADFPHHHPVDTIELAQRAFQRAMDVELSCPVADQIEVSRIAWAHILKRNWTRIGDLLSWRDAYRYQIEPTFREVVAQLQNHALEENHPEFSAWIETYKNVEKALFDSVNAMLEQEAAFRSRRISAALDEATRALKDCNSCELSQKTLRVLMGAPGVTSVLVGMRKPEYVTDVFGEKLEPLPEEVTRLCLEKIQEKWDQIFPSPAGADEERQPSV